MTSRSRASATAALLLAGLVGASSSATEVESVLGPRIDALFSFVQPGEPGGTVAVLLDGSIAYQRAYGLAKVAGGVPNTTSTRYYIASISKQFTAMCVLLLQEQGLVSLEDAIRTHVPELPSAYSAVKVRHLVHMMGGVPYVMQEADLERADSVAFIWNKLLTMPTLASTPGTTPDYSNTSYFLLGALVERKTGRTLRQFSTEQLFTRLGMNETFFKDDANEAIPGFADGHQLNLSPFTTIASLVGPGGVVTNVGDMQKWDRNFSANRLGAAPGDQRLITQAETIGAFNSGVPNTLNYAAGLFVDSYDGERQVWHDGAAVGFRSSYYRYPALRLSVLLFLNRSDQTSGPKSQAITSLLMNEVRFASDPPPAATQATAYRFSFSATGAPRPTYVLESGALPDGLSLTPEGLLSGTPTRAGPFTGAVRASNGRASSTQPFTINVAPVAAPALAWEPVAFLESIANDGTFTGASVRVELVGGGTLASGPFVAGTHFVASRVPAGLALTVTRTSPTALVLGLSGAALAHEASDGTTNLGLTFLDAAFVGTGAGPVANATRADLPVTFRNSALSYEPGPFAEAAANDGTIPGTKAVTLVGGASFASGPFVSGTHFTATNVPSGLRLDVTRDGPTQLTLRLALAATAHQFSNSTKALGLAFRDAAFAGRTAAQVTDATRNDLAISFRDPVGTPVTVTFQQGTNGYGDTRDLGTRSDELGLSKGWNSGNDVLAYTLNAGAFGLNYFVKFRKLGLPPGASVNGAELSLSGVFARTTALTGGYLTVDWDPTASLPDLGWTNAGAGRPWSRPGGLGDVLAGKAISYNFLGSVNTEQRVTMPLDRAVVQEWVSDEAKNLGVVLVPVRDDTMIRFRSSSFFTLAARPKLSVTYVAPVDPTITSALPPATGVVGRAWSHQVTASGSSSLPLTFRATGLPALGLAMDAGGLISGTPTAPGTISGTLTVSNGSLHDATQPFAITITPAPVPPSLTNPTTASGTVGVDFVFPITADHGPSSYAATGLPGGLALAPTTGVISGTPTVAGTFPVTLSATNDTGTGSATLTLAIARGTQEITGFPALPPLTYGATPLVLTGLSGFASGQPVTLTCDDPTIATITGSTLTIRGSGTTRLVAHQAGDANYFPAPDVARTLAVAPAPLSLVAVDARRNYGDANPVFAGRLSGLVQGDTITATFESAATVTTPAGTYGPGAPEAITPRLVDPDERRVHYDVTTTAGTLTIEQATQLLVGFEPIAIRTYGDAPFELGAVRGGGAERPVTFTSSDEEVATVSGSTLTIVGAGEATLTAQQEGDANHTPAVPVTRVLTVAKASLVVSAEDAAREEGHANPAFSGSISGVVAGDTIGATYASTATEDTPPGTYGPTSDEAITPSLVDPDDRLRHYDVTLNPGTLTITAAPIDCTTCGSPGCAPCDPEPDAGPDPEPDAGPDALTDAGPDASADAGPDPVPDAGPDASADAGLDAMPDAGSEPDPQPTPACGSCDAASGAGWLAMLALLANRRRPRRPY